MKKQAYFILILLFFMTGTGQAETVRIASNDLNVNVSFTRGEMVDLNLKAEVGQKIWLLLKFPFIYPNIQFARANETYYQRNGRYVSLFSHEGNLSSDSEDLYYTASCKTPRLDLGLHDFSGLGQIIITVQKGQSSNRLEMIQELTLTEEVENPSNGGTGQLPDDDQSGGNPSSQVETFTIVDTGQTKCYDNTGEILCPAPGESFYGQDAQYEGTQFSYRDNGDGTVTDLNTGLMWQQDPGSKTTWEEAVSGQSSFNLAGYTDWRLPTIKELYSLINFNGEMRRSEQGSTPYIDTNYFVFSYGDTNAGERLIDSQYISSTKYVSTTMHGNETAFGVNFADGRIKGYGLTDPRTQEGKKFYVTYVRGDTGYGVNHFVDNGDGTITDSATGLVWMQVDSGHLNAGDDGDGKLNWEQALEWCENIEYAGHSDWRLPNAKELQSIVDYTRSPDTTLSAAIDPVFSTTSIIDEGGETNYPFYWTNTTHLDGPGSAVYVAFGEALGWMQSPSGEYELMDVHGAGAQRSDPKIGDPADYPYGFGPQGDVRRIYNYARCMRGK